MNIFNNNIFKEFRIKEIHSYGWFINIIILLLLLYIKIIYKGHYLLYSICYLGILY